MLPKEQINVVIVGAGFGGLNVARTLTKHRHPRLQITLINPSTDFLFTPLLPEVATNGVAASNAVEPLAEILDLSTVQLVVGRALRVRRQDRVVETTTGEMAYDILVLATGSAANFMGLRVPTSTP